MPAEPAPEEEVPDKSTLPTGKETAKGDAALGDDKSPQDKKPQDPPEEPPREPSKAPTAGKRPAKAPRGGHRQNSRRDDVVQCDICQREIVNCASAWSQHRSSVYCLRESTTKKDGGHGTGAGIGQIRTSPMSISAGRHGNAASKGRVRLWLAVVVPLRRPARSNSQDPVVVAAARRGATQGRIEVMKGDAVAGGPRLLGRRKGIPDRGARRMSR
jgi:hypothetical protein